MKTLGRSRDRGFIVEMSQEEYQTLRLLESAMEGHSDVYNNAWLGEVFDGKHISAGFKAVYLWTRAKFGLNQFAKAVSVAQKAIGQEAK